MHLQISRVALVCVTVAVGIGATQTQAQQPNPLPFAPGERLTYSVTWSVFPAGDVTATLQRADDSHGDAYEVTATAESRGFVSLLYNLNDEFHSLFDPQTLCSREISKTVNEGRRHKRTRIVFDDQRKVAVLEERDLNKPGSPLKQAKNPIAPCTADVVTAFYFVRRQPLHVGERIEVPVNDGNKTVTVTAEVEAREEIDTALGKRYAFRVEPKVFGELYKRKGRMLIWFGDEPAHLPLRIKAMISVGAITGDLQSVTRVAPEAPASAAPFGSP